MILLSTIDVYHRYDDVHIRHCHLEGVRYLGGAGAGVHVHKIHGPHAAVVSARRVAVCLAVCVGQRGHRNSAFFFASLARGVRGVWRVSSSTAVAIRDDIESVAAAGDRVAVTDRDRGTRETG